MTDLRQIAARYIETLEARHWQEWEELLHPDVVYELPQTGEVVRGRERYLRFNREYPGDWHLRVLQTFSTDRSAVAWVAWTTTGGADTGEAIVFLDVDDTGLIARITDYWPERYEPPPGREHLVERRQE